MTVRIRLPQKVHDIIETLQAAGYEAYAVGGCIRDSVLGKEPDDWDITTSAKPEEVKKLFRRTIDTGIMHGTVTVMMDKEGFEVTTYRIDGKVLCRKPKRIPSHGIENIIALHPSLSRHNVQSRIRSWMSHMQSLSGRIRKFHQRIIFRFGIIIRSLKSLLVIPHLLPFCLHFSVIIYFCHFVDHTFPAINYKILLILF